MATYTQQFSSGSATAAGDLGAYGVVTTGAVGINPTHLAYGWYSVDASGRMWVTGAIAANITAGTVTAFISGTATVTGNVGISAGTVTAWLSGTATVSGNVSATQVTNPWIVQIQSGTQSFTRGSASGAGDLGLAHYYIQDNAGTSGVGAGDGRFTFATVNVSGHQWVKLTASTAYVQSSALSAYVYASALTAFISGSATVSGNVSATQVTNPWIVQMISGTQAFTVGSATAAADQGFAPMGFIDSAGTSGINGGTNRKWGQLAVNASGHQWVMLTGTGGNVTAQQGTSPWIVSAGITGGSVGVTGQVTATQATGNAAVSKVAAATANTVLITSNASRRGCTFFNESGTALYLKLGTTATTASYTVQMAFRDYYELPMPCFTGRIDGIWASATGAVLVTELT